MNYFIQILAILLTLLAFWLFFTIFFKPKKDRAVWVRMCPRCGSIDVKNTFLAGNITNLYKNINPNKFVCRKCKFEGFFPEVDVESLEDVRKKLKSAL